MCAVEPSHLACPLDKQEIMKNSHELEEFVWAASLERSRGSTGYYRIMIQHFQWEQTWNLPDGGGGKKTGTIDKEKKNEKIEKH